jgi:phosphoribosylpyrophosphate synthetase
MGWKGEKKKLISLQLLRNRFNKTDEQNKQIERGNPIEASMVTRVYQNAQDHIWNYEDSAVQFAQMIETQNDEWYRKEKLQIVFQKIILNDKILSSEYFYQLIL